MGVALLGAAPYLSGCAAFSSGIAPIRDTWQGASYEDVVTRWGAPARSTAFKEGDARLVHTWLSEGVSTRSSFWPTIGVSAGSGTGVGIGVGFGTGASRDVPVTCERTMVFLDGRVVDQTWYGPTAFCSTFRRH